MAERRAYFCTHKDHIDKREMSGRRLFLTPLDPPNYVPNCPDHEGRKMVRQNNIPYKSGKKKRS